MKPPKPQSDRKATLHSDSETRDCAVLIVDIAGTVELRRQLGEAVAGARIRTLLADIIAAAKAEGAEFIKSYGDDVMVSFSQEPKIEAAARAAIRAQRLARSAGLQLYAGVHAGDVEFRKTMGHPDAIGQTINITARLHKLTENAPGRIFMTVNQMLKLPEDLQAVSRSFGLHDLKGLGPVEVWTLGWQDDEATPQTVFSRTTADGSKDQNPQAPVLWLQYRSQRLCLRSESPRCVIGRSPDAQLCIMDPEVRVSSQHLQIESASGYWFVQDVSRNGTWLFDGRIQEQSTLPKRFPYSLPNSGLLCLGRPFEADPDGDFTVQFELAESVQRSDAEGQEFLTGVIPSSTPNRQDR